MFKVRMGGLARQRNPGSGLSSKEWDVRTPAILASSIPIVV